MRCAQEGAQVSDLRQDQAVRMYFNQIKDCTYGNDPKFLSALITLLSSHLERMEQVRDDGKLELDELPCVTVQGRGTGLLRFGARKFYFVQDGSVATMRATPDELLQSVLRNEPCKTDDFELSIGRKESPMGAGEMVTIKIIDQPGSAKSSTITCRRTAFIKAVTEAQKQFS